LIWSVYPGFSYGELLNLDVRDLNMWAKRAYRKSLEKKIHEIHVSLMPWMEAKEVNDEMRVYQNALEKLDGPIKKRYCKTWTEALGKGKG